MDGGVNRLVSVRLWNTNDNDREDSDRALYGWVLSDENDDYFEKLRVHLIFCPEVKVREMVSEMISLIDRGTLDEHGFENTSLGVFVEEVGFKILNAKTGVANGSNRINLDVTFVANKVEKLSFSSDSSQDSCDFDSMESASMYYTERLRDFFDGH